MDNDHKDLLGRIAKSLETIAAPPPDPVRQVADLESKLEAATHNWRGWHQKAVEAEAELPELRRRIATLTVDVAQKTFRCQELGDSLHKSKLEVANLISDNRRLSNQTSRVNDEYDAILERAHKAEVEVRQFEKVVAELSKSDFGKLHANYKASVERWRKRNAALTSRLSYWKRKKS